MQTERCVDWAQSMEHGLSERTALAGCIAISPGGVYTFAYFAEYVVAPKMPVRLGDHVSVNTPVKVLLVICSSIFAWATICR